MDLNEAVALINTQVRDLAAYHLVPETVPVKLNQNENPRDWPQEIKDEVADFVRTRPWNRYPPFIPQELRDELCGYAGVPRGSVIVGNGSNEVILVLLMALMNHSRPVILSQPTFTVYNLLARGLGGTVLDVRMRPDLGFDVAALEAASRANPGSLLILCSPNNPTGGALSRAEIERILGAHAGFLILDQAYIEFGGYNAVELLARHPNLIIARTFSKAFSGAGLRLGYMAGNPAVIEQVNKVKLPYNLGFFTEHVARALLRRIDLSRSLIGEICATRDRLVPFLRGLPFDNVYPTEANFILVRWRAKDALFAHLKDAGILVRDVSSYPMLENCLRISVGSPQENDLLMKALSSYFATATP